MPLCSLLRMFMTCQEWNMLPIAETSVKIYCPNHIFCNGHKTALLLNHLWIFFCVLFQSGIIFFFLYCSAYCIYWKYNSDLAFDLIWFAFGSKSIFWKMNFIKLSNLRLFILYLSCCKCKVSIYSKQKSLNYHILHIIFTLEHEPCRCAKCCTTFDIKHLTWIPMHQIGYRI